MSENLGGTARLRGQHVEPSATRNIAPCAPHGALRAASNDELSPADPALHLPGYRYYSGAQVIGGLVLVVDGRLATSFDETRAQFVELSVAGLVKLLDEPRFEVDRITAMVFQAPDQGSDVFGEVTCVRASPDAASAHLLLRSGCAVVVREDELRSDRGQCRRGLPVVWQHVADQSTPPAPLAMCA